MTDLYNQEEGALVSNTVVNTVPSAPVSNTTTVDNSNLTPFQKALAEAKDINDIRQVLTRRIKSVVNQELIDFLERHKNIKHIDTLLNRACQETDDVNIVVYLAERGADLKCTASLGLALETNHEKIADFLIENGASERPVLRDSAARGKLNIIKKLKARGINLHMMNEEALQEAATYGNLVIVKYLVEDGADIHEMNDLALRNAAAGGHVEVVKYLGSRGANIHAEKDDALKKALKYKHKLVADYLKFRGAKEEDSCVIL
jgi:ankyrin repeat protein